MLPLWLLVDDAVLLLNLLRLTIYTLCGFGGYLLARQLGSSHGPAVVAGRGLRLLTHAHRPDRSPEHARRPVASPDAALHAPLLAARPASRCVAVGGLLPARRLRLWLPRSDGARAAALLRPRALVGPLALSSRRGGGRDCRRTRVPAAARPARRGVRAARLRARPGRNADVLRLAGELPRHQLVESDLRRHHRAFPGRGGAGTSSRG